MDFTFESFVYWVILDIQNNNNNIINMDRISMMVIMKNVIMITEKTHVVIITGYETTKMTITIMKF